MLVIFLYLLAVGLLAVMMFNNNSYKRKAASVALAPVATLLILAIVWSINTP